MVTAVKESSYKHIYNMVFLKKKKSWQYEGSFIN